MNKRHEIKFGRAAAAYLAENPLPPRFDYTLTPKQYKELLEGWGYTQARFGNWLGVDPRTARRYASKGPPAAVARFMMLMDAEKMTPEEVDKRIRKLWK